MDYKPLIKDLEKQVKASIEYGEKATEKDWGNENGVLLSRHEAEIFLNLLKAL